MKFIVSKHGGFCNGVRRAVDTAMRIPIENAYVYGEIIHNPDVVKSISDRGIICTESLEAVPPRATLLIRSHGIKKSDYDYCAQKEIKIVDCTCEFVRNIQKIVERESAAGRKIVITGDRAHPEVVGLVGWSSTPVTVIATEEEAEALAISEDYCLLSQTTFSLEKFEKISKILKTKCVNLVAIYKTICYTTQCRQTEAEALSQQCDGIIVIGGLNSSNTNKLYSICRKHCQKVFRVERFGEVDLDEIKTLKRIGVVMGASTPGLQTQEVKLMEELEQIVNSMEDVVADMDKAQAKLKRNQVVEATISSADENGLQVMLSGHFTKKEIFVDKSEVDCEVYSKEEYDAKAANNEKIQLVVVAMNPIKLSQKEIRRAKEEAAMIADIEAGNEFTVECTGFNKGGLTANLGSYAVFVPAKEIRSSYVKELDKMVGKKLRLKCIEIKRGEYKKEIIASQRVILEAEKKAREEAKLAKENEFFTQIQEGDVVEGEVKRIGKDKSGKDFGAFVSVGGFDCLAHVSDLSWTGAKHVADVLEIGKRYEFKVLKVDAEAKKVSIGYKQLQDQPWEAIAKQYVAGDTIHGKIARLVPFGAFVEVAKGVDGLVHVSQISHEWLADPQSVLHVGDEVDAKILALDAAAKKMTLSIKALAPEPEVKKVAPRKNEKAEGEKEAKPRKQRANKNPDEMTEYKDEGSVGGISISDLLKSNK